MNETPKICDFNHLILYSKGWYKHTNFLEDIRTIMAHRCGTLPEFMSNEDIWALLIHAAEKYLSDYNFTEVITRMFTTSHFDEPPTTAFMAWEGQTSWIRPAKMIVSKLQEVTCKGEGSFNVGCPDSSVLPLIENCEEKWGRMV